MAGASSEVLDTLIKLKFPENLEWRGSHDTETEIKLI